jgi:hypothetical protein
MQGMVDRKTAEHRHIACMEQRHHGADVHGLGGQQMQILLQLGQMVHVAASGGHSLLVPYKRGGKKNTERQRR